jgi:hypothetical protein
VSEFFFGDVSILINKFLAKFQQKVFAHVILNLLYSRYADADVLPKILVVYETSSVFG